MKGIWRRRPKRRGEPPCVGCGPVQEPALSVPDPAEIPGSDAVAHRVPGTLAAVIGQELVLLDPATSRFRSLSTSAALVYTSIDGVASAETIASAIAADLGIEPSGRATLDHDVRMALGALAHDGAVTFTPPDPSPSLNGRWTARRRRLIDGAPWPIVLGPIRAGEATVRFCFAEGARSVAARVEPLLALLPEADAGGTTVTVAVTGGGDRALKLYRDAAPPIRARDEALAAELLLSVCNQVATAGSRGLRFHAGVVERDGRAVLICGRSGAGKSSLTASLVADGWGYLSDEVGIVVPPDNQLVAYPKWLDLSAEALTVVGHQPPDPLPVTDFEHHLPPTSLGAVSAGATVAAIVVLDGRAGTGDPPIPDIAHAPAEAVPVLLPHLFVDSWDHDGALQDLADLCVAVPVVNLPRGPLPDMCAAVAALVQPER